MFQSKAAGNLFTTPEKRKRLTILLVSSALALHLSIVVAMSILGPLAIFPTMIDSNGVGISFAIDSTWNRIDAVNLAQVLRHRGIFEWIKYPAPFHAKLYSLSFAVFDPWSDFSILTAEPVNGLLYLLILILVYKIGAEVCDRRAGLIAAAVVAVWPSFLLHTTQFLREPQIIAATLLLVLIGARSLTRTFSWRQGVIATALTALALAIIWLIRAEMWELIVAVLAIGTILLIARQLTERGFLAANLLSIVLVLPIAVIIPRVVPRFLSWQVQERTTLEPKAAQPGTLNFNLADRITLVRHRYYHLAAGSNVDEDVQFKNSVDIVRYLPRAAAIGFLAPFPNMLLVPGSNVGRSGRLLSGLETAVIYVAELLAVVTLWLRRRQWGVWFLATVCAVSFTAMGLIVANVSIIYRLRYAFMMLVIILGTDGALQLVSLAKSARTKSAPVVIVNANDRIAC